MWWGRLGAGEGVIAGRGRKIQSRENSSNEGSETLNRLFYLGILSSMVFENKKLGVVGKIRMSNCDRRKEAAVYLMLYWLK